MIQEDQSSTCHVAQVIVCLDIHGTALWLEHTAFSGTVGGLCFARQGTCKLSVPLTLNSLPVQRLRKLSPV